MTRPLALAVALTASLLLPRATAAQWLPPPASLGTGEPTQVISTNPLGLMLQFYNAEYELRITESMTAGAGASRLGGAQFSELSRNSYANGDLFVRIYPGGRAFHGLALGFKAGATRLGDDGTYGGVGIDINHSSAVNDHLVIGTGVGLKRLLRHKTDLATTVMIPTFRFNIGVGFP